MLKRTVQIAVVMMVSLFGRSTPRTMMAKTIVANPLGPNHPINILSLNGIAVLVSDSRTGIIRIRVRLKMA